MQLSGHFEGSSAHLSFYIKCTQVWHTGLGLKDQGRRFNVISSLFFGTRHFEWIRL